MQLRIAGPDDAKQIALLHVDSWRRVYRGAYSDTYLDGDIVTDRLSVWSTRLAAPAHALTVVAEDDHTSLAGFIHVIFDEDPRWGSLIDNLHVTHNRQRTGVGKTLLTNAAHAVVERATARTVYLWVQEQNIAAQQFYRAMQGTYLERTPITPPGGVPSRLTGTPHKLRFAWSDAALLADS